MVTGPGGLPLIPNPDFDTARNYYKDPNDGLAVSVFTLPEKRICLAYEIKTAKLIRSEAGNEGVKLFYKDTETFENVISTLEDAHFHDNTG